MTFTDPYGRDVLSGGRSAHRRPSSQKVPADPGLVVEEVATGFVGAILQVQKAPGGFSVVLEDRMGTRRAFELGAGFWIDGRPVELTRPKHRGPEYRIGADGAPGARRTQAGPPPGRTASGSIAVPESPARVARPSRIWVEGKHDAELVEKIWGEDLRYEGVVVEPLGGLDVLAERLAEFRPDAQHRVGVLADHVVSGSKESRIAAEVMSHRAYSGSVHIIGHPFIDIWAAVKPAVVGIRAWPEVPRGEDWKLGTLARIGWPHADHRDTARAWARILRSVSTMGDVDPALSGRVEELIDFVTVGHS
ncbi:DUF3097 domain-containing protein [Brevibacterium sp. 50QC2O2]|uniref:DUF3097 domain-containing protein n=1 Tax=Brevibacterium TaxID=1696 RepID=UPI00211CEDEB|nr:DUF3097 domain-containing protein [Brevibacterium sp. 91QC2O2]MCQ9384082.1 DUF3097 domain-containing protein [Brevibacterium sp. 68QC2CO]MCQ9388440.1 DUF3097 domain-containing protein [Brevibacterium sp. 50QC2O2]